jgi:hypothetical protein
VTTCERDQIEDAYEQIGGDRDVRERRMSRLAGQAPESLELAALERQRGSEREVARGLPPFERLALCCEDGSGRPPRRPTVDSVCRSGRRHLSLRPRRALAYRDHHNRNVAAIDDLVHRPTDNQIVRRAVTLGSDDQHHCLQSCRDA